jgi:hypothetical protein
MRLEAEPIQKCATAPRASTASKWLKAMAANQTRPAKHPGISSIYRSAAARSDNHEPPNHPMRREAEPVQKCAPAPRASTSLQRLKAMAANQARPAKHPGISSIYHPAVA